MDGKYILLLVLIYTAIIQDIKAAKLTTTPSQNLQPGATSLTIRCSPDSNSGYTKLHTMEMYKETMGQYPVRRMVAKVGAPGTETLGFGMNPPKYIISVFLDQNPTSNLLDVVIHNPDCHHGAEYTCQTTGETASSPHPVHLKDSKTVTVQSNPDTVEMKIFPEKLKYEVGEKIDITCQTGVGIPEYTWTWESKSRVDPSFTVRVENARESQVDTETSIQCGYNSGSTLQHHVGMEDDGLKIRCMVDNSELYSAIKTIYLTLDDVKKGVLLADKERINLEQEKLKQQISKNSTNCNCCCN